MVCRDCDQREAVCVPVIIVPVNINGRRLPVPLYLLFKGGLCNRCAYSFTLQKWTDYDGSWYDFAGDGLRDYRKPSENPFPDDPTWNWEAVMLNPNYEPAPREECVLKYWDIRALDAGRMTMNMETRKLRLSK